MDVILNILGFIAYIYILFFTNGFLAFIRFGLYFESLYLIYSGITSSPRKMDDVYLGIFIFVIVLIPRLIVLHFKEKNKQKQEAAHYEAKLKEHFSAGYAFQQGAEAARRRSQSQQTYAFGETDTSDSKFYSQDTDNTSHFQSENSQSQTENKHTTDQRSGPSSTQFDPFAGCGDLESLKKRYYQLLKMYHTDNPNGDTFAAQWLNAEFERQKQKFNSNT